MSRPVRLIAVATVVALSGAPAATALGPRPIPEVDPPSVDSTLLPEASTPAPPGPTRQRGQCFAPTTRAADGTHNPIELDAVWRLTKGRGQTVAVIDTGVVRHRLLPHLMGGGDYVGRGDGTTDCDGHGTIVAGLIGGAPDGLGFSGIAPEATILSIRQSSTKFAVEGQAPGVGDVDTLARAVRTAADLGATVINISSVACVAATDRLDDRALGAALAYAVDVKNVVVVTAAGNIGGVGQCPEQNPPPAPAGGPDWDTVRSVASPAWYDDLVLTVGSVGRDGAASDFTLAGPWVDVATPGEEVVSLHPDADGLIDLLAAGKPISGTSYAAPVVAGIAALVRSRFPQLSARDVMRRIEATAHRPPAGWDPFVGSGVVDALAAVSGGTPASAAPVTEPLLPPPSAAAADGRPRRIAFGGAAACIVAALLIMLSARRSRDRTGDGQPVTDD
ncbi:type VII secretion-associated serine protease mycosin [Mycobacterium aquaticum]|uniref:Type VII secretion-associated serine protease mycosin n=1 Tax=Mycobacterium aquaticum TaxID=1927124 RepID=A0A1W9ZWC9_9MYCO|nr:type VII secretion-associated serine protease mycosin [Mycobacterium aquaticum]ORA21995.1 type VII secretion-associated serine protease mycosin [Mycobacterium aquaticum]